MRTLFSAPLSTTFTDDGNENKYTFSKNQANASNFISFVSIFTGGTHGTQKNLTIMFDEDGIIKRYSLDESAVATKTGILQ